MSDLEKIRQRAEQFTLERDWRQFHSPKNLAMALTVEAAELQECFLWLTEEESKNLTDKQLAAVRDEIADVQTFLVRLADELNIDIAAAFEQKMIQNEAKYPKDKVRGSAKKYTEYE